MKTSPENIVETEEKQVEKKESEKPENAEKGSAADDNDLSEKVSGFEKESPSSFLLISPRGDEIEWAVYSEGVYCYSDGSLWGYLSEDGEEITSCTYEEAAPFSEGLACVRLNGKYGYIGKEGKEAIPFRYDQAVSFREGAAYFSCGEEYGLINHRGDVILDLTDSGFDSISSFREGLAYFSVDGLYGYMDKSGEIVIDPVYGDAGYFYDGLAKIVKDGYLGLIGKDGREVLSPEYSDIQVEETDIIAQKDGEVYCFDKNGEEIFSGSWTNVRENEDAFCIEKDEQGTENTEQFLLTNQITPAVGPFFKYLKTGSITADTGGPQYTTYMKKLPPGRKFCKLYRMGSGNDLVLYFYSEPLRTSDYQESDSGMFTLKDGKVIQLVEANECDAPIGGDLACFWYDKKENMLKPGTEGTWGGRGSLRGGGDMFVYSMEKGQAVLENSLIYSWEPAPDGGMVTEHIVNDEEVSEEEYAKVRKRYQNYMPIDHIRTEEEY